MNTVMIRLDTWTSKIILSLFNSKYLPEGFRLGLHNELELAELAAPDIGGLDPLLETSLVHIAQ